MVKFLGAIAVFIPSCFPRRKCIQTPTFACLNRGIQTPTFVCLKVHSDSDICLSQQVHSDSDIHLDATGSFKRFDPVDRDVRVAITTSSLMGNCGGSPPATASIPPQPLRPAPAPQPTRPAPAPPTVERPPEPSENLLAEVTTVSTAMVPADDPDSGEQLPPALQRAMSCDSVCSDTSVVLGDLEEPNVTGYLCVGLEYDSDSADLVVSVLEAKDLVASDNNGSIDTYVRVYLLPDKTTNMQTRTNCPSYKEKFLFGLEASEFAKRSLNFYVYASDKYSNTLIGEAELKLCDVTPRQPVTTWLTLTDTGQRGTQFGELMFSLSYLPTAERLTVVIVKARNLKFPQGRESGDPFVKVYLLQHGKKIHKKRTSTKKGERSPIFNEAMIFSVPAHTLQVSSLCLAGRIAIVGLFARYYYSPGMIWCPAVSTVTDTSLKTGLPFPENTTNHFQMCRSKAV
ncbi:hypothetical protein Cfor_11711 [Coptotermes formosanus]|uniref:C2 domain-containing protein n=1 Tax=Coptotermes formosanus TaxID=36987 RepID=A0A6L2PM59_COPFO|nr:hypothetical protein Cfor_11711 [Coptotermes formosanus]